VKGQDNWGGYAKKEYAIPLGKLNEENADPNANKQDDISVKKRQKPQLSQLDKAVAQYLLAQDGPSSSQQEEFVSFCQSVGIPDIEKKAAQLHQGIEEDSEKEELEK